MTQTDDIIHRPTQSLRRHQKLDARLRNASIYTAVRFEHCPISDFFDPSDAIPPYKILESDTRSPIKMCHWCRDLERLLSREKHVRLPSHPSTTRLPLSIYPRDNLLLAPPPPSTPPAPAHPAQDRKTAPRDLVSQPPGHYARTPCRPKKYAC